MVVGWEVNSREWYVSKETGGSTLVKAKNTQVFDDPHGGSTRGTFHVLGDLSLYLETDFDDFERIGEDLS